MHIVGCRGMGMVWWRRVRLGLAATMAGAVLGIPAVLAAAGVRDWRLLAAGAAAAALLSAGSQVSRARWSRARLRRDDQLSALAEGCGGNADGTLKAVRDFRNPVRLGVHEAAAVSQLDDEGLAGRVPAYVPRDVIDDRLRQRLATVGFVLVTGPSAAGKSRAAYEAVQATVPGHRLIAPDGRRYLAAALDRFEHERRCVLWLDDVERFTGPDGLTRAAIGRVLDGRGHHRLIVATIRDGELERHVPDETGLDAAGKELRRGVREALELAWKIEVRSTFSAAELARARASDDPQIARALQRRGEYGITQYLAAAPRLLAVWRSGREHCPRGAALVAAAVDCRRAGLTGPVPRRLIEQWHELYLGRPANGNQRAETLRAAWAWATSPPAGISVPFLRSTGQDDYAVFDYLIDAVQRHVTADDLIPRQVLSSALRYAGPAEAQSIGWTAAAQDMWEVGLLAFGQAYNALAGTMGNEHPELLRVRANLAHAQHACSMFEEAEAGFRTAIGSCRRVLGNRDRLTLATQINYCHLLADAGKLTDADAAYQSVLGALDGFEDLELSTRNGLATLNFNRGRYPEAEEGFRLLVTACTAKYGPSHIDTLTSRCYWALALERMDRLQEAQEEQEAAFAALEVTWGPEHFFTLQSLSNLAAVMRKQGRLEESRAAYARVLEIRTRVLRPGHIATLQGHACLAGVLADQNRLPDAEAAYRIVTSGFARRFGDFHPETVQVRREFANLLQRIGKIREAEKQRGLIRQAAEEEPRLGQTLNPGTTHHPLNARETFTAIRQVLRRRIPSLSSLGVYAGSQRRPCGGRGSPADRPAIPRIVPAVARPRHHLSPDTRGNQICGGSPP
jgi:tetratricopeptide (TPR) repeat protein